MNRSATLSNSMMLVLLLGASGSVASALATLLMFALIVGLYHLCMAPLRTRLSTESLLFASLLLAATLSSCADTLLQRWSLQWYTMISLYCGLIGLQCVLLEQRGFFTQHAGECLQLCSRFAGLLMLLAALRELLGQSLDLLTLTPGAFILLGLLLAALQAWKGPIALPEETHRP